MPSAATVGATTTWPGLNVGDCFAYALSKSTGEPLLLKARDFPILRLWP
jgi:uncharacterized protein with PIN domain